MPVAFLSLEVSNDAGGLARDRSDAVGGRRSACRQSPVPIFTGVVRHRGGRALAAYAGTLPSTRPPTSTTPAHRAARSREAITAVNTIAPPLAAARGIGRRHRYPAGRNVPDHHQSRPRRECECCRRFRVVMSPNYSAAASPSTAQARPTRSSTRRVATGVFDIVPLVAVQLCDHAGRRHNPNGQRPRRPTPTSAALSTSGPAPPSPSTTAPSPTISRRAPRAAPSRTVAR